MNESKAIPIKEVKRALDKMKYASPTRVMFEMLVLTGCRLSELDNMKQSQIRDNVLYWKLGKNQRQYRKIELPPPYVEELKAHREQHKVKADSLFSMKHDTFRRIFNREERPIINGAWTELTDKFVQGLFVKEYKLQLKGLRKNYQTLLFKQNYEKWKDSSVALEFTSKEMKHSTTHITAYHYLVNFSELGKEQCVVEHLLSFPAQMRLTDFL